MKLKKIHSQQNVLKINCRESRYVFFRAIFALLFFLSFLSLQAQKITVDAKMDSTIIWIGEQTLFSFELTQQPEQRVVFPLFSDHIPGGLDIVEPLKIDSVHSIDGRLIVKHSYLVTAFQDSLLYISPFPFVVDGDTVWSKSVLLKVIQPFELDMESNAIADIKPVYKLKFNWLLLLLKIYLLLILILALVAGLYTLIRKYIQKKPVFELLNIEPELPAHIVALEALNKIKDEKAWQHGRLKEYYTELTDTIRMYIGKTYAINAMEMTSDEIMDTLRYMKKGEKTHYEKLQKMLQTADLVKFAKWKPLNDESERSLKDAFSFVEQTKPEEIIQKSSETDSPADAIINEEVAENATK